MLNSALLNFTYCNCSNQSNFEDCFFKLLNLKYYFDTKLFDLLLEDIILLEYNPKNVIVVSCLERLTNSSYFYNLVATDQFKLMNYDDLVKWEESKDSTVPEELMIACVNFYNKGIS
jgi:hypothetical protein